MTAPALIKRADLRSMAEIAKREGVAIEVKRGDMIIRITPDNTSNTPVAKKGGVAL